MVRKAFTLIIQTALGLFILCFAAAFLMPPGHSSRENYRRSSCQSNEKQILLSFRSYVIDADGRLPPIIRTGAYCGWADTLQPYIRSTAIYSCPSEIHSPQPNPRLAGYTDYWMNARIGEKQNKDMHAIALTIAFGDGNSGSDNTNASYRLAQLPAAWMSNKSSPAKRHLDAANYGFVDGHVKFFRPEKVKTTPTSYGAPTFALQ